MKKSSQNSKVEVSVIIVNYNTGGYLKKCVESVVRSCPQCEVIVVDNNSTDGSFELIQKPKVKNQNYNSKIKTIRNNDNPGFSKANNQAIKIAQGDYVLLLNPDAEVKESAIQKLVDFAKAHTDAGVIGSKLILADGTTQKSVFHFPTIWRAVCEFWFDRNTYSSYVPDGPVAVDAVVGAAFLITPQALQKVGLLNERYFMYFEDLDYCRRVWNSDLKVYYLPSAEIIHYHGTSGKSLTPDENQWRRLIPGSKIYHGLFGHWLINFIIWTSQKLK